MDWAEEKAKGVSNPSKSATDKILKRASDSPDDARAPGFYPRFIKPLLDRVGGMLLLILFLPLIVVSALTVWMKLGRPIFFRQARIGRNGEQFDMWKLRTMVPDRRRADREFSGDDRREVHKSPDDPRVTPAGKVLRAWRLDELPQLWNVVAGDMSLVGPRPEMPAIVDQYEDWQHRRHTVKPGLTGPWQVSDRNGDLMHECTDLDLVYVDRVTFAHDLTLLAKTPGAMLGRRKGY